MKKQPAILIYADGTVDHVAAIRSGDLRRACHAILAQLDEVVVRPSIPAPPDAGSEGGE